MSSKPSLDVYWGGFLYNSCSPLELSLNWCSHSCHYCFANLNKPGRKSNIKQAVNLLADYHDRDSYASHLLREGYPVVFSNHVDPFAFSNDAQALPLIEIMSEVGIPFSLQTKGGKRIYEALDRLTRPTVFYYSIATLDEEVARRVEPGAPTIADRFKMIEAIIDRGHKVLAGINPVVAAWLPDPFKLTSILSGLGVSGVWVQPLHLSHRQLKVMPDRGREALGEEVIRQALNPRKFSVVHETYIKTREAAIASGLEVYDNQQAQPSNYFQPYRDCYPKTYPLMQDWVNHCHATKRSGDAIYWEEFRDFFVPKLPIGTWGLRDHLNAAVVPQSLYGMQIPQRMNYSELLWHCWQHKETLFSPVNVRCFSWAADRELQADGKMGWTRYIDDNQNPILIFVPQGTSEAFMQWSC